MKKTLSNKEIRELNEKISLYNFQFDKKDRVEIADDIYVKIGSEVSFFKSGDLFFPALKFLLKNDIAIKKITVDMGAVKFVVNGADIMRPGIVHIEDDIRKDDPVVILDVNNKKPLAIGKALFSSDEMRSLQSGKVIKNLHWVGDRIWLL